MRNFFVLSLFMLLAVEQIPGVARAQQAEPRRFARDTLLTSYLVRMANALDCYFTLEEDMLVSKISTFSIRGEWNESITTIDDLIKVLAKALPDMIVSKDESNPQIINIRSRPKANATNPLDSAISLAFTGSLRELVNESNKQTDRLVRYPGMMDSSTAFIDGTTKVSFPSMTTSLRELLTQFLPLSRYSRILWSAQNHVFNGKNEVWLRYGGSYKLIDEGDKRWMAAASGIVLPVPFEQGSTAYIFNPVSEVLHDEALAFIAAQMKAKEPRQVRWAMFYLGKNKVERAIPLLLQYLDYQYAPSPIIEERFPALRALGEIGKPAATLSLSKLPTETDAQRLELLSRVVLKISGKEKGQSQIEALMEVAAKPQSDRMRAALAKALKPGATATIPEHIEKPTPQSTASPATIPRN